MSRAIWFDAYDFPNCAHASLANTSILETHCPAPELAELGRLPKSNKTKIGRPEPEKQNVGMELLNGCRKTVMSRAIPPSGFALDHSTALSEFLVRFLELSEPVCQP
jgi:hypothetical protein